MQEALSSRKPGEAMRNAVANHATRSPLTRAATQNTARTRSALNVTVINRGAATEPEMCFSTQATKKVCSGG